MSGMKIDVDIVAKDLVSAIVKRIEQNYAKGQKQMQTATDKTTEAVEKQTKALDKAAQAATKASRAKPATATPNSNNALNSQRVFLAKAWDPSSNLIEKRNLQSLSGLTAGFARMRDESKTAWVQTKNGVKTLDDASLSMVRFRLKANLASRTLDNMAANLVNTGKNAQWTGRQMMVGITAPVMMLGGAAVKSAMEVADLDIILRKLVHQPGMSETTLEKNLASLEAQATSLSETFGIGAKEVKTMQSTFAQIGFNTSEIEKATQATTEFTSVGEASAETAVELVRTLKQVAGLKFEDGSLTKELQRFNIIADVTNLDMEQIANSVPRLISLFKGFNVRPAEIAALISGITEAGLEEEQAATALKSIMVKYPQGLGAGIIDRSANRLGALKETIAEVNRITGTGLSLEDPVTGEMRDGVDMISQLAAAYKALNSQPDDMKGRAESLMLIRDVFGQTQGEKGIQLLEAMSRAMDPLTASGTDLAKAMAAARDESSLLSEEWQNQLSVYLGSDSVQLKNQMNEMINAGRKLGQKLIPVLSKVFDWINNIIEKFEGLSEGTQNTILKLVAAFALLGPVVYAAGQGMLVFGTIGRGLMAIPKSLTKLRKGFDQVINGVDGYAEKMEAVSDQYRNGVIDHDQYIDKIEKMTQEQRILGLETEKTTGKMASQKAEMIAAGSGTAAAASTVDPDVNIPAGKKGRYATALGTFDPDPTGRLQAQEMLPVLNRARSPEEQLFGEFASDQRRKAAEEDAKLRKAVADWESEIDTRTGNLYGEFSSVNDSLAELDLEEQRVLEDMTKASGSRKQVHTLQSLAREFTETSIPFIDVADGMDAIDDRAPHIVKNFTDSLKDDLVRQSDFTKKGIKDAMKGLNIAGEFDDLVDPKDLKRLATEMYTGTKGVDTQGLGDAISSAVAKSRGLGTASFEMNSYPDIAKRIAATRAETDLPVPLTNDQLTRMQELMTTGAKHENYQGKVDKGSAADSKFTMATAKKELLEELNKRRTKDSGIADAFATLELSDAEIEKYLRSQPGGDSGPIMMKRRMAKVKKARDKIFEKFTKAERKHIGDNFRANKFGTMLEGFSPGKKPETAASSDSQRQMKGAAEKYLGWDDEDGKRKVLNNAGFDPITEINEGVQKQLREIGMEVKQGAAGPDFSRQWQTQYAKTAREAFFAEEAMKSTEARIKEQEGILKSLTDNDHLEGTKKQLANLEAKRAGMNPNVPQEYFDKLDDEIKDVRGRIADFGNADRVDKVKGKLRKLGDDKTNIKVRKDRSEHVLKVLRKNIPEKHAEALQNMLFGGRRRDSGKKGGGVVEGYVDTIHKEVRGNLQERITELQGVVNEGYDDFVKTNKDILGDKEKLKKAITSARKRGTPGWDKRADILEGFMELQDIDDFLDSDNDGELKAKHAENEKEIKELDSHLKKSKTGKDYSQHDMKSLRGLRDNVKKKLAETKRMPKDAKAVASRVQRVEEEIAQLKLDEAEATRQWHADDKIAAKAMTPKRKKLEAELLRVRSLAHKDALRKLHDDLQGDKVLNQYGYVSDEELAGKRRNYASAAKAERTSFSDGSSLVRGFEDEAYKAARSEFTDAQNARAALGKNYGTRSSGFKTKLKDLRSKIEVLRGGPEVRQKAIDGFQAQLDEINEASNDVHAKDTLKAENVGIQKKLKRRSVAKDQRNGIAETIRQALIPETKRVKDAQKEIKEIQSLMDGDFTNLYNETNAVMDDLSSHALRDLNVPGVGVDGQQIADTYKRSSQIRLAGLQKTKTGLQSIGQEIDEVSVAADEGFGYISEGRMDEPRLSPHATIEGIDHHMDDLASRIEGNDEVVRHLDRRVRDLDQTADVKSNTDLKRLETARAQALARREEIAEELETLKNLKAQEIESSFVDVGGEIDPETGKVMAELQNYRGHRSAEIKSIMGDRSIKELGVMERRQVAKLIADDLIEQEKTEAMIRSAQMTELDKRVNTTTRDEARKRSIMERIRGKDKYLGPEDADNTIIDMHADDISNGRLQREHISDQDIFDFQEQQREKRKSSFIDAIPDDMHGPFAPDGGHDKKGLRGLPATAFKEVADDGGKKMVRVLPDIVDGVDDLGKAGKKATGKGGILNAASWLNPLNLMKKMKMGGMESALSPLLVGQMGGMGSGLATVIATVAPLLPIIIAIGGAIALVWANWDKVKTGLGKGFESLKTAFNTLKDAVFGPLAQLWDRLSGEDNRGSKAGEGLTDMWTNIGKVIDWVSDKIASLINWLAPVIEATMSQVAGYIEVVINIIQAVLEALQGNWGSAWDHMYEAVKLFGITLHNLFMEIIIGIVRLFAKLPSMIVGAMVQVANGIAGVFSKIPGIGAIVGDKQIDASGILSEYEDITNGWIDSLREGITLDNPYGGGDGQGFLGGILDKFKKEGDKEAEEVGPIEMPAPMADAGETADNAKEAVQNFISALQGRLRKMVDGWKDAALKAFDDYAKGFVDAIDAKIEAINKEMKAEKERDADLAYLRRKQELRDKKQSMRIKHQTDRDAAISEGRFDEAQQMDYDYGQEVADVAKEEKQVEEDRQRELTDRVREGEIERLNIEKENAQKMLDLRREQLQQQLDLMTEYIPKNVAEAERMHSEIQAKMNEFTGGYGVIAANQAAAWGMTWAGAFEGARKDVADQAWWSGMVAMKEFAAGLGIDPNSLNSGGTAGSGAASAGAAPTPMGNRYDLNGDGKIDEEEFKKAGGGGLFNSTFHSGGQVSGRQGPPQDVPATLQSGEYVIKRSAVNNVGTDFLDKINSDNPVFHDGGAVGIAKSAMSKKFSEITDKFKAGGRIGGRKDANGNWVGGFTMDEYKAELKRKHDEVHNPFQGGEVGSGPLWGVHPRLVAAFNAFNNLMGGGLSVVSGYRDTKKQAYLYDLYKSGRGNEAAPPGKSNHEYGLALDIAPNANQAMKNIAATVGLAYTVPGEPWHIQVEGLNRHTIGRGPGPATEQPIQTPGGGNPNFRLRDDLIKAPELPNGDGSLFQGVLTGAQVAGHVIDQGKITNPQKVAIMTAVSARESGWNPAARAVDSDDDSWGLFQINVRPEANPQYRGWNLADPGVNAQVMGIMSGHGSNLRPWAMNPDGSAMYRGYEINKWMDSAKQGAREALTARGMPSLDVGGDILKDGVAKVHAGETVITSKVSSALANSNVQPNFTAADIGSIIASAMDRHSHSDNSTGGYDGPMIALSLGSYLGSDRELEKLMEALETRIIPKLQRARGNEQRKFSSKKY